MSHRRRIKFLLYCSLSAAAAFAFCRPVLPQRRPVPPAMTCTSCVLPTPMDVDIPMCVSRRITPPPCRGVEHCLRFPPHRGVDRIPGEIWAHIFQLGAESYPWTFPVLAASVCRTWRAAAKHHPRCWSRILTRVGRGRPIHYEFQLARLFLKRSRHTSLHVSLDLSRASDPQSAVLLNLFANQLARCSSFAFSGRVSHMVIGDCFAELWSVTSRLQELSLTLTGLTQGFAPELTLGDANPCAWTGALPAQTYPRVHSVKLDFPDAIGMPPDAFVSLFHSYPNLERLDVRVGRGVSTTVPQWDFCPPLTPVVPWRLKELRLEGVSIADLAAALDFRKLALVSLSVHALGSHVRDPFVAASAIPLPTALCNPSSTLASLELGGYTLAGPAFLPLLRTLRGLPHLERLALSHVRLDAQLFHALQYPMPGMRSWAVPRLARLELHQISLGLARHRQWAWALDVARRRNVAARCGACVDKLAELRCDMVGNDGRMLMDLREMAPGGPIGVRVSSPGHGMSFFV